MSEILVVYRFKDNLTDAEIRETNSISDLDIIVQETMQEVEAFNQNNVEGLEFYVYVHSKFPKFILTKKVDLCATSQ